MIAPHKDKLVVHQDQKKEICNIPSLIYEHWLCTYFYMTYG